MLNLLKDSIRPLYRYFKQSNLRTFYKFLSLYKNKPRYQPFYDVHFNGFSVDIIDSGSFIWQYKDIFVDESYRFAAESTSPIIYDCGANIGTSVLYFKNIYPNAKIKAFEADEKVFKFLTKNIQQNNFKNVLLINKAVWIHNDGVGFTPDGADGGSISNEKSLIVPSIRLKECLIKEEYIDLLKIDIEGAETDVILDCADVLGCVKNIFIEYHSLQNQPQSLSKILTILERQGFRYFIESVSQRKIPFINKIVSLSMDLQLNIYAYKL